jgi:hypothetical protein
VKKIIGLIIVLMAGLAAVLFAVIPGPASAGNGKLSTQSGETVSSLPSTERVSTPMTMPGLTVTPADPTAVVVTSPQAAALAASAVGIDGTDKTDVQPTVQYGLLSETAGGAVTPPGAAPSSGSQSVSPGPYQKTPVWVVTYPGVTTPANGPAPPPGGFKPSPSTVPSTVPAGSGSLYIFVDDSTGKYFMAESY